MTALAPKLRVRLCAVLRAVSEGQFELQFEELPIGGIAVKNFGTPLPEKTLEKCLASDAVLLGAVGGPEFDSLPPALKPETGLLAIRKALGGFANLRPAIAYDVLAECSPLRPEVLKGADHSLRARVAGRSLFRPAPRIRRRRRFAHRLQHHGVFGAGDRARRPRRLPGGAAAPQQGDLGR